MIKKIAFFVFFTQLIIAQNNSAWRGYFSYNQVKDITETNEGFFSASENTVFFQNINSNELKTINSIDGLKSETITKIYHSKAFNKTLIGNQNGLLLVLNADGTFLFKNGIQADIPVPQNLKQINHFSENNGKIYISTNYGITVFDLTTSEFGDTYYISTTGAPSKVFQTTILNNEIIAASENALRKINLSNPNIIDFNQWQTVNPNFINGVTSNNNKIIVSQYYVLYSFNGSTFPVIKNFNEPILDIRTSGDYTIGTSMNNVYIFNSSLIEVAHIQTNQVLNQTVEFSCATVIGDKIFIGTKENGIIKTTLLNTFNFETILPNGPEKNNIFSVKSSGNVAWAVYGGYDKNYDPFPLGGNSPKPISKFTTNNGWSKLPFSSLLGAKALTGVTFSPTNNETVFVSSYFSGLLKIENDIPTILYNQLNTGTTGLQVGSTTYNDVRINIPAFDKNGNLWMTNSQINSPIKVFNANGSWNTFSTSAITLPTAESYGPLVVDKNNTKWIPSINNGVIGFNETLGNKVLTMKVGPNDGNLPVSSVYCLAIDTKNQLWIGTIRGLRILPNVDSFLTETELKSKNIVILENDLAQELFFDQFIVDIVVDGANRKWVSIANSGVYLVSPNGQQTIYRFTSLNSPLPSDNVNDIEINSTTGEVFFATDKGMVSFRGVSTKASENLENVFV